MLCFGLRVSIFEFFSSSGNSLEQEQLPLDDRGQGHDEKYEQGFHPERPPEDMGPGDAQYDENGGTGEEVLYREKQKIAPVQIIGKDRVPFHGPVIHQVKGEKGVREGQEDD